VASKKEFDIYQNTLNPNHYAAIHIGKKGLVQQREYITQQYPKGTRIVFMDDDIESIDLSMTRLASTLHTFLEKAFDITVQHNSTIWGVYPVFNPFYRKPRPEVYVGLAYVVGAFYGIITEPNDRSIRLSLTRKDGQKEDVERTIRYFNKDGRVVRFDRVGFVTKYYGKSGGLGTFEDRLEPMKQAVIRLQKAFPELGSMYIKKTGMSEFRFNRTVVQQKRIHKV
jgi:hypothetical protein